jgi:hypothetical protein
MITLECKAAGRRKIPSASSFFLFSINFLRTSIKANIDLVDITFHRISGRNPFESNTGTSVHHTHDRDGRHDSSNTTTGPTRSLSKPLKNNFQKARSIKPATHCLSQWSAPLTTTTRWTIWRAHLLNMQKHAASRDLRRRPINILELGYSNPRQCEKPCS